ncbi:MAG: hypothetical protein QOI99_1743, partial [Actinomycetota bacterium]|nr:hypothetical protein [Actinomycetota bacterium]
MTPSVSTPKRVEDHFNIFRSGSLPFSDGGFQAHGTSVDLGV